MGMIVRPALCSSGSSSSEDMTIGCRRVAVRFCRGIGSSGSESEEISKTTGLARCVFRDFFPSVFSMSRLGREDKGDVVIGLTCAPVFETLHSFVTVLPLSSKTVISTSTTGEGGGFLTSFVGDSTTCVDSTLIDTAGSLGANGRRTDVGPPMGFDETFFFAIDFLTTGGTVFGLMGEGNGEVSDTGSSSVIAVTRGETTVLPLAVALVKLSVVTILCARLP